VTGDLERELHALAGSEPGERVLSLYARTDPRDPANTNHVPGWLIAARNHLRSVQAAAERDGDRERRLALLELANRAQQRLEALAPDERGRSAALFLTPSGALERRLTLQLPVREDGAFWDERPFVSPLVDVVDRGRPAGVVLVGSEHVRLLHTEQGRIDEPEGSTWTFSVPEWRRYAAYAAANPTRGQQTATHHEHYRARLENRREQFFAAAARATEARLRELGWPRVVIAAEGQVAERFTAALSSDLRDRAIAVLDANLGDTDPPSVATYLEPVLERAWRREVETLVDEILHAAAAGSRAAAGPAMTFAALAEHRVEHLLIDPPRVDTEAAMSAQAATILRGAPPAMSAERAVEAAIAAGARVSAVPNGLAELAEVGGMAARLRW
jgi:Bacterial archaeo-eukaryotic release factor family 10